MQKCSAAPKMHCDTFGRDICGWHWISSRIRSGATCTGGWRICLLAARFFTDILEKVEKVSELLQEKQTNLAKALELILSVRDYLASMRQSRLYSTILWKGWSTLQQIQNCTECCTKTHKKKLRSWMTLLWWKRWEKALLTFIQFTPASSTFFNLRLFTCLLYTSDAADD